MINEQNKGNKNWILITIISVLVILVIVLSVFLILNIIGKDSDKKTSVIKDSVLPEGESVGETDEGNPVKMNIEEEVKTEEEEIKEQAFLIVDKMFIDVEPTVSLENRLIYTDYPNAIQKKVWAVRYQKDYIGVTLIFDAETGEFLFSEGF